MHFSIRNYGKAMALFVVAYFFAVLGVNLALDRMEKSPTQSSFTLLDQQGRLVLTYHGDLSLCPVAPLPGVVPATTPVASEQQPLANRWF